jgi:hypothetical protein
MSKTLIKIWEVQRDGQEDVLTFFQEVFGIWAQHILAQIPSSLDFRRFLLGESSQIRGVIPRIKMRRWNPLLDRSIETVRQLSQVSEPYRMLSKEVKAKKKHTPIKLFLKIH